MNSKERKLVFDLVGKILSLICIFGFLIYAAIFAKDFTGPQVAMMFLILAILLNQ